MAQMSARVGLLSLSALLCLPECRAAWTLLWSDDFDGPSVNTSLWNVYANVSEGSNQIELYTANNVFIEHDPSTGNGWLVLQTQQQNVSWEGHKYNVTSGRVDTSNKANVTAPARVVVSARLQPDALSSGIHTAHWLLGYACWPIGGEIDIMECQSPGNAYSACPADPFQKATSNYHIGTTTCGVETHHSTGTSSWPHAANPEINFSAYFTEFSVEWNTTDMVYAVNGTVVNHVYVGMPGWSAPFAIPTWDMYLILSQAYMADRPCGNPKQWPVSQYIDYVRAYAWEN